MTVFLKPEDIAVIEKLAASDPTETVRKRVRLLLLYEAGMKTAEIAEKVGLSSGRVLYWRRRYLRDGLGVFGDALTDPSQGKEVKDSPVVATTKPVRLAKLLKQIEKARKSSDVPDGAKRELSIALERVEKQRKKLKKRLERAKKKKAKKVRDRLKTLDRRIKKAKKLLKKLES